MGIMSTETTTGDIGSMTIEGGQRTVCIAHKREDLDHGRRTTGESQRNTNSLF